MSMCILTGHRWKLKVRFFMIETRTTVHENGTTETSECEKVYAEGYECTRCKTRHATMVAQTRDLKMDGLISQWADCHIADSYEEKIDTSVERSDNPVFVVGHSETQAAAPQPLPVTVPPRRPTLKLVVNNK